MEIVLYGQRSETFLSSSVYFISGFSSVVSVWGAQDWQAGWVRWSFCCYQGRHHKSKSYGVVEWTMVSTNSLMYLPLQVILWVLCGTIDMVTWMWMRCFKLFRTGWWLACPMSTASTVNVVPVSVVASNIKSLGLPGGLWHLSRCFTLICVDDYRMFTWVYFLSQKTIFFHFKEWLVKKDLDKPVKIWADKGGKFISNAFTRFCAAWGNWLTLAHLQRMGSWACTCMHK